MGGSHARARARHGDHGSIGPKRQVFCGFGGDPRRFGTRITRGSHEDQRAPAGAGLTVVRGVTCPGWSPIASPVAGTIVWGETRSVVRFRERRANLRDPTYLPPVAGGPNHILCRARPVPTL